MLKINSGLFLVALLGLTRVIPFSISITQNLLQIFFFFLFSLQHGNMDGFHNINHRNDVCIYIVNIQPMPQNSVAST